MPLKEKKDSRADVVIVAEQADDLLGDTLSDLIPTPEKPY